MNCKAAIITAVKVETDSVMCLYDNWKKVTFYGDAQEYYQASFSRNGKEYSLVTAQQNAMGMTAAAFLSAKIMSRFHPEYLIMCGIAAGLGPESEQMYGDVMIPDTVWNCSSGKFTVPKDPAISFGEVGFLPRPVSLSLDSSLLEIVKPQRTLRI